ncbi:penicillin-binding protein 1C [Pseudorhodobacter antarcticus]|uniref:penicillin-binding protein 1C n=1 Tax=Pseudorhodobacter antarcticus TaxID=1077947 RepID=UPI001E4EA47F|nr:penicillin-binding protein 1C [Pseudorhodobacter antarcticus]
MARDAGDAWVDATVLPALGVETSVEVLARDGRLLRAYTVADGRWRMAVAEGAVDPAFAAMLVAYEDKRFYRHVGVDPWAVLRAVGQAVWNGRVVSGGSTLTMQVARLLEDSGTGQIVGKLRQMRVALALERRLTKGQILNLYYQIAPYGGNLEGVRAASIAYFGKEPRRLTPAQAALLVALPQSPERRRPDVRPEAAEAARGVVLERAVAAGVISGDQAQAAGREAVPRGRVDFPALAPHVADRVVRAAPGVLLHRTTIDYALQAQVEALAAQSVAALGDRLQVAIVVADHASGAILASVGSAAYQADARQGFIDMTRALRSPGSTLKPLVYGLAFDEGLAHPETLMDDRAMDFGGYAPQNFDRVFRGMVRVREALQLSLNLPVVALTDAMGVAKLMAGLRSAGVEAQVPGGAPGLAVALGGLGVRLEDMVGLYGAIARGGVARPLHVEGAGVEGARVMSGVAAWQVGDILSGMAPPVGAPVNRLAYKTGTSYGHRDAWALGFDGAHVVGVWMGRADGTPVPGAFGGDLAAPVLFQTFARIGRGLVPLGLPPAAALIVANAGLPQPLRVFRARGAAFVAAGPEVAFPPDGAEVEVMAEGMLLRVRGGVGPFTWLVDGRPVVVAARAREAMVATPGLGFVVVSVIDGAGQSARVRVRLR